MNQLSFDFGPLAAQNDPDILSYFYTTQQISNVLSKRKATSSFIFIARPGAGKTALFKWLENGKHKKHVIAIKPDAVRMIIEEDTSATSEDYRVLMATELFTGIIFELKKSGVLTPSLQKDCEEYAKNTWWKSVGNFFTEKFEGISIMGTGFSLKASDRQAYLREIRKDQKLQKATELLERIAKETNVIVAIDNPEYIVGHGFDDVDSKNAIRIGAFLSVLNQLHSLGIQVIVLVKEHIIQSVQEFYRDFSHFEDRIESLEWTGQDLINSSCYRR